MTKTYLSAFFVVGLVVGGASTAFAKGDCGSLSTYADCTEISVTKFRASNTCTTAASCCTPKPIVEICKKQPDRDKDYHELCGKWMGFFKPEVAGDCKAKTSDSGNFGCYGCFEHRWVIIKNGCKYCDLYAPITPQVADTPAIGRSEKTSRSSCEKIERKSGVIWSKGVWDFMCDAYTPVKLPTGAVNSMPESTYGGSTSGYAAETRTYGTYKSHNFAPDATESCEQPRDPMKMMYSVFKQYPVWMSLEGTKWPADSVVTKTERPGESVADMELGSTSSCQADNIESDSPLSQISGYWSVSKCKGVIDPAGVVGLGYDNWPDFTSVVPSSPTDIGNFYSTSSGTPSKSGGTAHNTPTRDYTSGPPGGGSGASDNRLHEDHGWTGVDQRYYLMSWLLFLRATDQELGKFGIVPGEHQVSMSATSNWCVPSNDTDYLLLRTYNTWSWHESFSECSSGRPYCPRIYYGVDNFLTKYDNANYWDQTCLADLAAVTDCSGTRNLGIATNSSDASFTGKKTRVSRGGLQVKRKSGSKSGTKSGSSTSGSSVTGNSNVSVQSKYSVKYKGKTKKRKSKFKYVDFTPKVNTKMSGNFGDYASDAVGGAYNAVATFAGRPIYYTWDTYNACSVKKYTADQLWGNPTSPSLDLDTASIRADICNRSDSGQTSCVTKDTCN